MSAQAIDILPDLGSRTLVMGILNVTPDSFSDGGAFLDPASAIAQAVRMRDEGADIIDVGGESTRPGHVAISAEEEQARILPVLKALARGLSVPISIDSYKAATADAVLKAGAGIVNDVWGLQREPEIARVAAAHGAPVIVMHNRSEIDDRLDVIDEFRRFFGISIAIARAAGIPDHHIILDPGIGFGKSRRQNIDALHRLPELRAMGFPVLVGTSRKSLIGAITGRPAQERLAGTIASNVLAVAHGAEIIRVHDVAPHVDAVRVAETLLGRRP
jgi:dihydropteroate synthase